MQAEMVKTDGLELWSEDMEGVITPVLTIFYERMRKLEIGGGVTNNRENENHCPRKYPGGEIKRGSGDSSR